jgi:hypothetical protein
MIPLVFTEPEPELVAVIDLLSDHHLLDWGMSSVNIQSKGRVVKYPSVPYYRLKRVVWDWIMENLEGTKCEHRRSGVRLIFKNAKSAALFKIFWF